MNIGELRAKYMALDDQMSALYKEILDRLGSIDRYGLYKDLERIGKLQEYEKLDKEQCELLESVGVERFYNGEGIDITEDALEWCEQLLHGLECQE